MTKTFNPLPLFFVPTAPVSEGLARVALMNRSLWRNCALEFFSKSNLDSTFDEFWQYTSARILDAFTRAALSELACYATSKN